MAKERSLQVFSAHTALANTYESNNFLVEFYAFWHNNNNM